MYHIDNPKRDTHGGRRRGRVYTRYVGLDVAHMALSVRVACKLYSAHRVYYRDIASEKGLLSKIDKNLRLWYTIAISRIIVPFAHGLEVLHV